MIGRRSIFIFSYRFILDPCVVIFVQGSDSLMNTSILLINDFSLLYNLFLLCILLEEGVNLPLIAGGAVAGGVTLAIIAIVIVLMFRRYTKNGKFCNH